MYHGIIDPSEFIMVEKSCNEVTLLAENRQLKSLTIVLASVALIIGVTAIYYMSQDKNSDDQ